MKKNIKGFTLIELIIVIAILGILSAIGIPKFYKYVTNSKHTVCIQQRRLILEQYLVKITEDDYTDKKQLLKDIIDNEGAKYFDKEPLCPLDTEGEGFEIRGNEEDGFSLYCKYHDDEVIIYGDNIAYMSYDFSEDTLEDIDGKIEKWGNWKQSEDGDSIYVEGASFLFIPNNNEEYSLSVDAKRTNTDGYGIIFDTTVDSDKKETGLIFQFDYNKKSLLINTRVDSKETDTIEQVSLSGVNAKDDEWWADDHNVELEVEKDSTDSSKKIVTVYIDGEEMLTSQYDNLNNVAGLATYTGFRSWDNSKNSGDINEIYDIEITK